MSAPHQALVLGEYVWIVVIGSFAAFLFGFGTGSNDVANAFGTSVGSKTLTLMQAVVIAVIFEFTGALVLGRVSQETVSGGIADISAFQSDPEFFAYGMLWALMIGGIWQILASTLELNVSATHSIIGAIVGFAMAYKGAGAVIWAQEQVVCTGPLIGLSPCEGVVCPDEPDKLMYKDGYGYLGGTYTVDVADLFGPDGNPISRVNVAWLTAMTGLNITNCANAACTGNPPSGAATYYVNLPGYSNTSVFFGIKTALKSGQVYDCSGLNCPITPGKTSPVRPYQMMYESKAPFCTTSSNSAAPFPPYKGVLIIVLSWFFSPVLTGIASAILFNLARFLVLRHENAYKRSFLVLPFMAFLTFWVNIYFVLTKGAAKLLSKEAEGWTTVKAGWICACIAGGISLLSIVFVAPLLHRRVNTTFLKKQEEAAAEEAAREAEVAAEKDREEKGIKKEDEEPAAAPVEQKGLAKFMHKARDAAMHGLEADMFSLVDEDPIVAAIHKHAEIFDEKAEMVFSYMQVFSAICVIFAHGAGEVGYMSGPLGAIWLVIRSGSLLSNSSPPIWTVVVGALGLVIGLATYGYQVTRAMGCRLAKLTPSRGFSAELATSLIIMIASQYGLPTSSSQCITGGILGVALCEGKAAVNVRFFLETFSSWFMTMICMALLTAFFFSQGAYAPSVQMSRIIGYYEDSLTARSELLFKGYQTMLKNSGYNTADNSEVFSAYLSTTIANLGPGKYYQYTPNPPGFYPHTTAPLVQTIPPWQMVGYLDAALALISTATAPNPYGPMMCAGGFSAANFPWYAKVNTTAGTIITPSTNGPCNGVPTLNAAVPGTTLGLSGFPASLNSVLSLIPADANICLAAGASLPACTGAVGEIPATGAGLAAAGFAAFSQTINAAKAAVTAFAAGFTLNTNPAAPAIADIAPITGTVCLPAAVTALPACSGAASDVEASGLVAMLATAAADYASMKTKVAAFATGMASTNGLTAYRAAAVKAALTVKVPSFTGATFLGPNPRCPSLPGFVCAADQTRFVDVKGVSTQFNQTVDRLFRAWGGYNGHVTIDQQEVKATPAAATTFLGKPELTAGTASCLQPPCNVGYPERPWYNGR